MKIMGRKFLLILGGVVFLGAIAFGVFWSFRLRPGNQTPTSQTPSTTPDVISEEAVKTWANMMLEKYPYKKDYFSGVLPAKSKLEVWVVGFRGGGNNYPDQYIGVKNDYGEFYARLSESALFTKQASDDPTSEKIQVETATPEEIAPGNPVAMRMTFFKDFAIILEVRRLQR